MNLAGLKAILGLNRRNRDLIYQGNHRRDCRTADDKLLARQALERSGLPMPDLLGVVETVGHIRRTLDFLRRSPAPVAVKPCRGSGGRGIFFVRGDLGGGLQKLDGRALDERQVKLHLSTILAGEFSLRSGMDKVILEGYVTTDSGLRTLSPLGAPDIRVLLYRGDPIFAMARIPTEKSDGRGNLHQGALGVGLDLKTGKGSQAVLRGKLVRHHPDTGVAVHELTVPYWSRILELSRAAVKAIPLGYAGLDLMIDETRGPLIIEINAHPGLAIQLANGIGLRTVLRQADMNRRDTGSA